MILKAFLSRHPERKDALERFLPDSERLRLEEIPAAAEVSPEMFTNGGVLERVHWSWFLPTLKTYPEDEQKLFLSAVSPFAGQNLAHELGVPPPAQEITETGRSYLRQMLIQSLVGPHDRLVPIDYLPPTPLKPLLYLSKKELSKLANLLSLHDLAAELRQIVETKILKKIYSFLSDEEKKHLKQAATYQKETGQRMGLDRWDGNEESLRALLHRRGLARLGAALSGQDPDFIWYICHQMDIGRGNALSKLCSKEPVPGLTDALIRQIEEILANPGELS
jgi:hypothetical protein